MGALKIIPQDDIWDFLPTKAVATLRSYDMRVKHLANSSNSWEPSMGT